jgi:hypothetical protein
MTSAFDRLVTGSDTSATWSGRLEIDPLDVGAASAQWGSRDGPAGPSCLRMTYDLCPADVKAAFPPCQAKAVDQ